MVFMGIDMRIRKVGYGQYVITGNYCGVDIDVYTTNSEAYDWLDDDSDIERHNDAKWYCYNAIVRCYNESYVEGVGL